MANTQSPRSILKAKTRVGVVEIGSRGVRLLVADVSKDSGLQTVARESRNTQLASSILAEDGSVRGELQEISKWVKVFSEKSRALEASHFTIFGTAALRSLQQKSEASFHELLEIVPSINVLSQKSEALCSLMTAVAGHPADLARASNVLTIDQGAGSTEIAIGDLSGAQVDLVEYNSYSRLGTRSLVEKLNSKKGNIDNLQKEVRSWIKKYNLVGQNIVSPTILFGSAATKCAWLKVLSGFREKDSTTDIHAVDYSPELIHGQKLTIKLIDSTIDAALLKPDQLRNIIVRRSDRNNPHGKREFENVVAGLIALSALLHKLEKREVIVSGWAARYGMAWALAADDPRFMNANPIS